MKKFLMNEFEEKTLKTEKEFRDFLAFRKEHDDWRKILLKDVLVVGVPNEPLFQTGEELPRVVVKNDIKYPVAVPMTEDARFIIGLDRGMFASVPASNIPPTPLSESGYGTLLQRAGIGGKVMRTFVGTRVKRTLSLEKKQDILNDCFGLNAPDSQAWGWMLFRDGRIPAFMSSVYGVFNCWDLCNCLEKQMTLEHPDFAFKEATVTEGFLAVEYLLKDDLADDRMLHLLQSFGLQVKSLDLGIGLSTSDTGMSEVAIYPILYLNGLKLRFGRSIGIRHDSSNDLKKYIDLLPQAAVLFDECEDRIEELGNTPIKDVNMTVMAVAEDRKTLFNNKVKSQQRQQSRLSASQSGTAMDVYLKLYEMAEDFIADTNPSLFYKLKILEDVAGLMFLDFTKFDK